jgi:hypothetical protein
VTAKRWSLKAVRSLRLFLQCRSNIVVLVTVLSSLAWAVSGWAAAPTLAQLVAVVAASLLTAGLALDQLPQAKKNTVTRPFDSFTMAWSPRIR